jgi:hypoxanthine-guanine phosphoribosyltransferase
MPSDVGSALPTQSTTTVNNNNNTNNVSNGNNNNNNDKDDDDGEDSYVNIVDDVVDEDAVLSHVRHEAEPVMQEEDEMVFVNC